MTPSHCVVVLFVDPPLCDIDRFLFGLSDSRRGETELVDAYRRMESGEQTQPAIKESLIEIPGLAEMIRLVHSWRASSLLAEAELPALGFDKAAEAIRAELDSLEKAPEVPLTRDDIERFPQHDEFRGFLQREEQAARRIKAILEAVVANVMERVT